MRRVARAERVRLVLSTTITGPRLWSGLSSAFVKGLLFFIS
jgi:hypothetical protein